MFKQKTTWAGISTIFAAIGFAVVTKDFSQIGPGIMAGLGLILAQDN